MSARQVLRVWSTGLPLAVLLLGCEPEEVESRPALPPGLQSSAGLRGTVTHGDGATPARAVEVRAVCGCGVSYRAVTDHDGAFAWPSVVDGGYTLEATRGIFTGTAGTSVVDGASLPVEISLQLDPVRVATLGGGADDVAGLLATLGYSSTPVSAAELGVSTTYTPLRMLLIGSGASLEPLDDPGTRQLLQQFVDGGGFVYLSDRAYPYLQQLWPDRIPLRASPEIGNPQQVRATAVDLDLWDLLKGEDAEIVFSQSDWAVLDSQPSSTEVLLEADVQTSAGLLSEVPLAASRAVGQGLLVFTSFHRQGQLTTDMRRVLGYMLLLQGR